MVEFSSTCTVTFRHLVTIKADEICKSAKIKGYTVTNGRENPRSSSRKVTVKINGSSWKDSTNKAKEFREWSIDSGNAYASSIE